jgi:hypothetical protein
MQRKDASIKNLATAVQQQALRSAGRIVVVRTTTRTLTGCLVSVRPTFIRLRIFSAILNRFIIIVIPFRIIRFIRLFPC